MAALSFLKMQPYRPLTSDFFETKLCGSLLLSFASCTCVCATLSCLVLMKEKGEHCLLWNAGCGLAHVCWELNSLEPCLVVCTVF